MLGILFFFGLIFGLFFYCCFLRSDFDDFSLLRFVIRSERFGFLIEDDAERFKFGFWVATNRDAIEILIKNYGKTLIESESIVLIFDESEFGLVFGVFLVFYRWSSEFMRDILDKGLILDEVIVWPIALSEKDVYIFWGENLCLWENLQFEVTEFFRIV